MVTLEYLQGYLSAIADINSHYDQNIAYDFTIEEVNRKQTPLETIISAHQDWEGRHLARYEFELTLLPNGYKGLAARLNEWLLPYEVNLIRAAQSTIDVSEQLLALRQSTTDENLSPCTRFVRALEEYAQEEVSFYEYYLKNWTRKKETPSNYGFTMIGTQVLLWGSEKALRLVIELSD